MDIRLYRDIYIVEINDYAQKEEEICTKFNKIGSSLKFNRILFQPTNLNNEFNCNIGKVVILFYVGQNGKPVGEIT